MNASSPQKRSSLTLNQENQCKKVEGYIGHRAE